MCVRGVAGRRGGLAAAVVVVGLLSACSTATGQAEPEVATTVDASPSSSSSLRPTSSPPTSSPPTSSPPTSSPPPSSPSASSPSASSPSASSPGSLAPTAATPSTAPTPANGAAAWCARTATDVAGSLANAEITEASGIVASRAYPGVYWVHNDGPDTRIFAVGEDGSDLGAIDLGLGGTVGATDIEDIALVDRDGVTELLLADIGDNGRERASIQLIRVAEPDPSSLETADAEAVEFVYPDGPHNAETLLVDEAAGVFVIVTKEQDESGLAPDGLGTTLPALVFEGPLDATADGGPVELVARGTLDLPLLAESASRSPAHPAELLDAAGPATGGDVSVDGSLIALRTYQTVWLWDREPDQRVADALQAEPCEMTAVFEPQGEAVAFSGDRLVSVGEGLNPPLHLLAG